MSESGVQGQPAHSAPTHHHPTPHQFTDAGFNVKIESGAGTASTFSDDMYKQAGAEITDTAGAWSADLVLHLRPPTSKEAELVGDRMLCRCDPPAVRPRSSFWLGGWGCCTRAAPRGGTLDRGSATSGHSSLHALDP